MLRTIAKSPKPPLMQLSLDNLVCRIDHPDVARSLLLLLISCLMFISDFRLSWLLAFGTLLQSRRHSRPPRFHSRMTRITKSSLEKDSKSDGRESDFVSVLPCNFLGFLFSLPPLPVQTIPSLISRFASNVLNSYCIKNTHRTLYSTEHVSGQRNHHVSKSGWRRGHRDGSVGTLKKNEIFFFETCKREVMPAPPLFIVLWDS